jgi:hypothetical protein
MITDSQNSGIICFKIAGVCAGVLVLWLLIGCGKAYGQTKTTHEDSVALIQRETNAFIDSLAKNTSISQFQLFMYENVSAKQYNDGKFSELWNTYLQLQYSAWIQRKQKHKK